MATQAIVITTEKVLQAFIAFSTNLSCIPVVWHCIKRGSAYEGIIGIACAVSSMMYHVGEVFENTWWFKLSGMTSGQWHRLDNIFTILTFQALTFFLMDIQNQQVADALRWTFLVFTLYCQERAPWEIIFTVIPIVSTLVLLIIRHVLKQKVPEWIKTKHFLYGIGFFFVAAFFFVRGLDDDNDYLRINHGIWHFFIGVAFYFIFLSKEKLNEKNLLHVRYINLKYK
ncbi:hypothetical protein DICPUDRAFT_38112 [Dictyostelium purpureum]|uniref:Post-GPI attachment to proteins factor 3 n=1 Tax=Dictyostelium purpureum TaxID=5786 RepID=F0ZTV3_DICPU|nr:uncharacterized protein DICPUDRAFT_38112 [Dictyostelium purpureum]EGC32626.1 hypothetical protein DICPUDRAFT_38112 [Dictyostelium purpureum]|eukprot:XP_003290841.1 hypothetical protein DICPUDRAFT_38112 [Dictyostelium purpureum]